MDHFLYRDGILHAEDVAIPDIALAVGTPFYVYSTATLTRHYRLFTEALSPLPHLVCFAIKSLSNVAVLKNGCGFGWRIPPGPRRRGSWQPDRVFRRWQDPRRDAAGA
jgi:hypothetical protein